jgi:hypothetical protein
MAAAVEVMVLVLEFQINFFMDVNGEHRYVDHLRDVIALRCTNRRPLGDLEIRTDLFLARGGMSHFRVARRMAVFQGQYMMGFLRALINDYDRQAMLRPRPMQQFRETPDQVLDAEIEALDRLHAAQARGVAVDLDSERDLLSSDEEPADESDAGSDMYVASDGAVTSSTEVPWGGYESESPPVSTEISIENHADIADLADLEGCLDDADVA